MKTKFVKEKGEICFKDKKGTIWTEDNLQDVINCVEKLTEGLETIKYLEGRLIHT